MGLSVRQEIELKVHLAQDEATCIWYIADSDIPGLHVEAETVHELIRKVEDVAPHLIELNVEEILANHHLRSPKRSARRPTVNIRPVFDTPMAVAGC